MLRITNVNESESHVTMRVEGQIVSTWVAELERETKRMLRSKRRVVLDFAGVKFIGPKGAEVLKRIVTDEVEIVNCSALIKDLLIERQKE